MKTDVLIVGGGIGGAVLALALGRRGWRVRILEREREPPRTARPEILQEVTIAAVERLGVGPRLREEATLPLRGLEARHHDERLLRISDDDFTAAGARPHATDPQRTRALLLDAALATGEVELIRGAEVTDLVREAERVTGARGRRDGESFEFDARLVVGDDGVRSVIRGGLGIPIKLRLFPLEFLTVALPRPAALPRNEGRVWLDPGALRGGAIAAGLFLPLPEDRTAAALLLPIGTLEERFAADPDAFWKSLADLTPLAATLRARFSFPEDFTRLRRPYGHAERYTADGAALIGDAAHPMSPAGAQGANASIWDALALAEVADQALQLDDVTRDRLLEYERRRRPANTRSLTFTRRAVTVIRLGRRLPGKGWLISALFRRADRSPATKRRLIRQVATAFLDSPPRP